ncbi:5'-3' exonuclease [Halalkalibacter hemicellulosilyticus]|uniref:5'-3' exonuclease n=1 Tax=Halalkalibacter hemicellulosilyticusJCM 9152 TaxID=1236971 RepID=W4QFB4_9BACI|nr:5'-3' exonuclease [Halalkalibacter hemicellulosilyticus]GAE30617.1 DNA polymerase I [Halalkalibacter hemicellulosilyticusJCM 9152]
MRPKVMLVDGMALLFRSFFATAMSGYYMINSQGTPTNAIHGSLKHLFMAINEFHPTHVICCWDMGSKTFRSEIYEPYKANRGEPPLELIPQFELIKEVMSELTIPNVGLEGYEADDCIGTLAKQLKEENDVLILTGDQDILQLLDDHVSVILLKKGYGNYHTYTKESFIIEKGITPIQLIELKALMGDTSDNYPGVKGIGEKTALQLLLKYDHVEGIKEQVASLTPAQRKKIEADREMIDICYKLATIHCEVPIECQLEEACLDIDRKRAMDMITKLELKGIDQFLP